jgi:hypothetical protein
VAQIKSHEIPVAVDGIVKSKTLFMLRGNYLKDLLYLYFGMFYLYFGMFYFYFSMQLGIDLCEVINVHRQPCP